MSKKESQSDGCWPYPTGTVESISKKKRKETKDRAVSDLPSPWPFPKSLPKETTKKKKK